MKYVVLRYNSHVIVYIKSNPVVWQSGMKLRCMHTWKQPLNLNIISSNIYAKDLINSITDTSHSINKLYWVP